MATLYKATLVLSENPTNTITREIHLGLGRNQIAKILLCRFHYGANAGADSIFLVHFYADPRIEGLQGSAAFPQLSDDVAEIGNIVQTIDSTTIGSRDHELRFPGEGMDVPTDLSVAIRSGRSATFDMKVDVYYEKHRASREYIDSLILFYGIGAEITPTEIDDNDQDQSADIDPSKQAAGEA